MEGGPGLAARVSGSARSPPRTARSTPKLRSRQGSFQFSVPVPPATERSSLKARLQNLAEEPEEGAGADDSAPMARHRFLKRGGYHLLPPTVLDQLGSKASVLATVACSFHGKPLEEWESENIIKMISSEASGVNSSTPGLQVDESSVFARLSKTTTETTGDNRDNYDPNWRSTAYDIEEQLKEEVDTAMREARHWDREWKNQIAGVRAGRRRRTKVDFVSRNRDLLADGVYTEEGRDRRLIEMYWLRQERIANVKMYQEQLKNQRASKYSGTQGPQSKAQAELEAKRQQTALEIQRQRQAMWITMIGLILRSLTWSKKLATVRQARQRQFRRLLAATNIQRAYRAWKGLEYTKETAALRYLASIDFLRKFRRAVKVQQSRRRAAVGLVLEFLHDHNDIRAQFRRVKTQVRRKIIKTQTHIRRYLEQLSGWKRTMGQNWEMAIKSEHQKARLGQTRVEAIPVPRGTKEGDIDFEGDPYWVACVAWHADLRRDGPGMGPGGASGESPKKLSGPMLCTQKLVTTVAAPLQVGQGVAQLEELKREMITELLFRMRWSIVLCCPTRAGIVYVREKEINRKQWRRYQKMIAGLIEHQHTKEERLNMLEKLFKLYPKPPFIPTFSAKVGASMHVSGSVGVAQLPESIVVQMVRWAHMQVKSSLLKRYVGSEGGRVGPEVDDDDDAK